LQDSAKIVITIVFSVKSYVDSSGQFYFSIKFDLFHDHFYFFIENHIFQPPFLTDIFNL